MLVVTCDRVVAVWGMVWPMLWVSAAAWLGFVILTAAWDRFVRQDCLKFSILPSSQQTRLVTRLMLQILPSFVESMLFMIRASTRQADATGIVVSIVIESIALLLALVRIAEAPVKLKAVVSVWTIVDILSFCSTIVAAVTSCHWIPQTPTEGAAGSYCLDTATGVVARTWVSFGFLRLIYARQALEAVEHLLLDGKSRTQSDMLLMGKQSGPQAADSPASMIEAVEAAAARANDEDDTSDLQRSNSTNSKQTSRKSSGLKARSSTAEANSQLDLGPHRMDPCRPAPDPTAVSGSSTGLRADRSATSNGGIKRQDSKARWRRARARLDARAHLRTPAFRHMILAYGSSWHSRMVRMVHGSGWAMADLLLQGSLAVLLLACTFYMLELLGEPTASLWQTDSGFWVQFVCSDLTRSNVPTADCLDEGFSPFAAIYFVLVTVTTVSLWNDTMSV